MSDSVVVPNKGRITRNGQEKPGYAQPGNRNDRTGGPVFPGRYQAILCQKDASFSELVRSIHWNPVRAKMVRRPEDSRWSSHRAYLGLDRSVGVDSDAVLRYFGARRQRAVAVYRALVKAGIKPGQRAEFYDATDGRLLGGEEFVTEVKHRMGEALVKVRRAKERWDWSPVVKRGAAALGVKRKAFQGRGRTVTP